MFINTSKCYHKSKLLCIPNYLVGNQSYMHILFLKEDDIQNLSEPSKLWRSTSPMPMAPTKSKERVSNVQEANTNKTQLLSTSHNHVQHNQTFCIIEYTYCQWVFYMFLSHLNLVRPKLEAVYIHLPLELVRTTFINPRNYLGWTTTTA